MTTVMEAAADGEYCLLDTLGAGFVVGVGATSAQITEADKYGVVFVRTPSTAAWASWVVQAEREVRPADVLVVDVGYGRPTSRWTVQPVPSAVEGWAGPSHRELRVKEA